MPLADPAGGDAAVHRRAEGEGLDERSIRVGSTLEARSITMRPEAKRCIHIDAHSGGRCLKDTGHDSTHIHASITGLLTTLVRQHLGGIPPFPYTPWQRAAPSPAVERGRKIHVPGEGPEGVGGARRVSTTRGEIEALLGFVSGLEAANEPPDCKGCLSEGEGHFHDCQMLALMKFLEEAKLERRRIAQALAVLDRIPSAPTGNVERARRILKGAEP